MDGTGGEPGLLPYVMLGVLAVVLVIACLFLKRNIRLKLQPMLDKFNNLEAQLRQE